MSKELVSISQDFTATRIYSIRGQRVMFDFDLAVFYEVELGTLKQRVRRNLRRFPRGFMFSITKVEWQELLATCDDLPAAIRCSTSLPVAFTAQGIAMLSSVLNSKKAIAVNIAIIRQVVKMGQLFRSYNDLLQKMEEIDRSIVDHDEIAHIIFQTIKELPEP